MRTKYIFLTIGGSILTLLAYGMPCDPEKGNHNPQEPPTPQSSPGDNAGMAALVSVDPNELEGPTGMDSVRWVSVNDVLNYTIYFENDPEFATAHAQIVDVRFDFPDKRLMKDFALGRYGFANNAFEIEDEPKVYSTRLDMKEKMDILVDLKAGFDVEKNQGYWRFSSIDPESGYAPWQVDRGLLPVNDSTHVGEGFVTFRIKPYEDMVTGDTISFNANIVFDSNDTIPTNNWKVTIDAGMPKSKIISKMDDNDYTHYLINFEASDDKNGSGLKRILLYQANNMGVYEEYAVCPVDTVVDLYTERGKCYNFISIAEDRAGNKEPFKDKPDLTLNFNAPPTDLLLSNTTFQDDIASDGFIAEMSSLDDEDDTEFTYALAEGDGAIHNDMFAVVGNRLQANECFKCSNDTVFKIRLSTTDVGGLTFSKAFELNLQRVLEQPEPQIMDIEICEGDSYDFFGEEYDKTGQYRYSVSNDFMCDSVYILNLTVKPVPQAPIVTIQNGKTLVSSSEIGNQWIKDDEPIEGATEPTYTPEESGIYWVVQTNGSCYSQPSDKYIANLNRDIDYSMNLEEGWSWISTSINEEEMPAPIEFLAPIEKEVERFIGSNEELINDPQYGLMGNLEKITPKSSYKIKMNEGSQLNIKGTVCDTEEVGINLRQGWNWIGYLPMTSMTLNDAFARLTPNEGDIVKSHEGFSVYTSGEWVGTLNTINPGDGLMYNSKSDAELYYPSTRLTRYVEPEVRLRSHVAAAEGSPWHYNIHSYPDNITIIAQPIVNDGIAAAGMFTVGAFVGKDCRGIGKYVGDKLFITVHGSAGDDQVWFKAIENATGAECSVDESLNFDMDIAGTIDSPFLLHISGTSGIADASASSEYVIYPNPVREKLFISGDQTMIQGVKIISMSGQLMVSNDEYRENSGIDVAHLSDGFYLCGIVTDKGIIYKRFIKKS